MNLILKKTSLDTSYTSEESTENGNSLKEIVTHLKGHVGILHTSQSDLVLDLGCRETFSSLPHNEGIYLYSHAH